MTKPKRKEKGDSKGGKPLESTLRLSSTTYFLTYKGISDSGEKITKKVLANYLLKQCPTNVKLSPIKYLICEQTYDSGEPHFHCILIYQKRKEIKMQNSFDYKDIHPNIQTMRNLKAALEYVYKEDSNPLTNMDIIQERRLARAKDSSSIFDLFKQQMEKDPFNFDFFRYCVDHNISSAVYKTNYSKAAVLLKKIQEATLNKLLFEKPGFKHIDRALIQSIFNPLEVQHFDSWSGYQRIVDFLNTMNTERGNRQQKSLNLLITGAPSTGKSALFWQRNPLPGRSSVSNYLPLYPMGMKDWFPDYKSDVYAGIYWNEAKLTSYAYDIILQVLDGSPVTLPTKGGGHKKVDNPLVIMTSNMTLNQMIKQKFNYNPSYQIMARSNLAVRIQNIIIP